jgi:hypothetical protein
MLSNSFGANYDQQTATYFLSDFASQRESKDGPGRRKQYKGLNGAKDLFCFAPFLINMLIFSFK